MRFAGGPEIGLDSEVELYGSGGEPDTASSGECCRFRDLDHLEEVAVEGARFVLCSSRHGELDVVDSGDVEARHEVSLPERTRAQMLKSSISPIRYAQL